MLSRVANSIYWLHRYIERAENSARFIDVNFNLALDLPPDLTEQWKPLLVALGDWELFQQLHNKPTKNNIIFFLGFDQRNPNSIYSCLNNARENARTIREHLTNEVWTNINNLYLMVKDYITRKSWNSKDPRLIFTDIKKGCQLNLGINDSTVAQTEGWHFGKVSRCLERADKTSRILDVKYHYLLPSVDSVGSPLDMLHWSALLKSVSAYNMYRQCYGRIQSFHIVEYLVLNPIFPRSILHCLTEAEKSLHAISETPNIGFKNEAEKKIGNVRSEIEYASTEDILEFGLHEYLDSLQFKINSVSDAIFDTYFAIKENLK